MLQVEDGSLIFTPIPHGNLQVTWDHDTVRMFWSLALDKCVLWVQPR